MAVVLHPAVDPKAKAKLEPTPIRPTLHPDLPQVFNFNTNHPPIQPDVAIWLWVKKRYPKWNSGKRKHGLKPAVWCFNFEHPYVHGPLIHHSALRHLPSALPLRVAGVLSNSSLVEASDISSSTSTRCDISPAGRFSSDHAREETGKASRGRGETGLSQTKEKEKRAPARPRCEKPKMQATSLWWFALGRRKHASNLQLSLCKCSSHGSQGPVLSKIPSMGPPSPGCYFFSVLWVISRRPSEN